MNGHDEVAFLNYLSHCYTSKYAYLDVVDVVLQMEACSNGLFSADGYGNIEMTSALATF